MTKRILLSLMILTLAVNAALGQTNYKNKNYGFKSKVPDDWHVYAELKDDPANKRSIVDWGLPKVYSTLEKASIENSISITAYKKPSLKKMADLIKFEFERIDHMLESKKPLNSKSHTSFEVITKRNGLKYKSKISFVIRNNVGYVLSFTATPGTYDINLPKFDRFVKSITFFKPKQKQTISNKGVRFDGLYIAKTGEIKTPNGLIKIYTYIRFYKDGTVYTQAINAYDPKKVAEWFGKGGRFERMGTYNRKGADIIFTVTNNSSPDKKIEGAKTDEFRGKTTDENKLYLEVKYDNGALMGFWFEFTSLD